MKIAFFCPHSDPLARPGEPDSGGQCVYEARVAAALTTQGHEVRCYTRYYGDKLEHEAIDEPGQAMVLRYPMGPEGFLRKEDMGPYLAEFTQRVVSDQRSWLEAADSFHGHYWDGGGAALGAAIALGKPLVFTSHSLGALKRERVPDKTADGSGFRYHIRIPAERRILHAADRIIALSQVERNALSDLYHTEPSKIAIVPGGVDIEAFAPKETKTVLKQRLGIETDFLVFTVGRLDPRKGFFELVAAIPHVVESLRRVNKTVTFLLPAGPEHPSAEELAYKQIMQAEAEAQNVASHIQWFPRLSDEDLKTRYAAADVFVCPSPYEPFGLVLVEAFASGTPVVATSHGGPREIVTAGVDGYLAEPSDMKAFAGRIVDILEQGDARRAEMAEAAVAKAKEQYAWSSVSRRIAEVYEQAATAYRLS
ncbi:MAG: glycosyltransferase [Gammaproteobacteria bacterium]